MIIDSDHKIPFEDEMLIANLECNVIVAAYDIIKYKIFQKIEVKPLSEEDCFELYKRNAYPTENPILFPSEVLAIKELISLVGQHTLILILLANIQKESYGLAEKLWNYIVREKIMAPYLMKARLENNLEKLVIQYLVKIFRLIEFEPKEIQILKLFTFFPNHTLSWDKAKQWFEIEDEKWLNNLIRKGWIHKNDESYLWIDSFTADLVREVYNISEKECEEMVRNITEDIHRVRVKYHMYSWQHIPSIYAMLNYFDKKNYSNVVFSDFFAMIGMIYSEMNKQHKAMNIMKKALTINTQVQRIDHPFTANIYSNMGNLYSQRRKHDEALLCYEKALEIKQKSFDKEDNQVAWIYVGIAQIYEEKRIYDQALFFYEKSYRIMENGLAEEKGILNESIIYFNMAGINRSQGRYDKCIEFYEKILQMRENAIEKLFPNLPTVYNSMANAYFNLHDYDMAQQYYEKALLLCEEIVACDHKFIAQVYGNIARMYNAQNSSKKAKEFYEKALKIMKSTGYSEHQDIVPIYNDIGQIYHKKGEYRKSLESYKEALKVTKKVFRFKYVNKALVYYNMSWVYYAQYDYKESLKCLKRAYTIYTSAYGKEHQDSRNTLERIEYIKKTQKKQSFFHRIYERFF